MPVIDTLITRYTMDNSDYVRGANQVQGSSAGMAASAGAAINPINLLTMALTAGAVAYGAFHVALLKVATASHSEFQSYDARVKALEAIEGSAKKAEAALVLLRESAKAPGLELQQAIEGYAQFRRLGLSQAASVRIVDAAGNANALGGGGAETFGSVLRALRQIITKPKVSAEEINQLEEAGVPVRGFMKEKYGTADSEQLAKLGISSTKFVEDLVASWENGAKALDSAQNRMDNLKSALTMSLVSIGQGMDEHLSGPITGLGDAVTQVADAGVLKNLGGAIGGLITGLANFEGSTDELADSLAVAIGTTTGMVQAVDALNAGLMSLLNNPIIKFIISMSPAGLAGAAVADATGLNANIRAGIEQAQMDMQLARARARNGRAGAEGDPSIDGEASSGPGLKPPSKADRHLEGIEKNTAALVQNFEDYAFGGGELGQQLTSPVNLSRIGRKSSDPLEEAMALIREYVGIEAMRIRGLGR